MQPIEEIETKVAFMDDLITTLNDTVFKQQQQIDQLNRKIDIFSKQLQSLKQGINLPEEEPPPPHY